MNTKLIQFKSYQKVTLEINYQHKHITLESVNLATLLAIEIESNINWKARVQKLTTKLSIFIYALCQLNAYRMSHF